MHGTLEDILELEQRTLAERAACEDRLKAIAVVKAALMDCKAVTSSEEESPSNPPPMIDVLLTTMEGKPKDWSVASLVVALERQGFVFESKTPASSVSTAVGRLVDRKKVIITQRGAGRRMSLYRAAKHAIATSTKRENLEDQGPGSSRVASIRLPPSVLDCGVS